MRTRELIIIWICIYLLAGLVAFFLATPVLETMMVALGLCLLVALYVAFSKPQDIPVEDSEESADTVETEDAHMENTRQDRPRTKGRVFGTLGTLYMMGYALYIYDTISGAEVRNLGEALGKAIAVQAFTPFFYCVLASALLSFVGTVGKNKMCMLLALTATIGAFFLLPGALNMLIMPAVFFLISFVRMAN